MNVPSDRCARLLYEMFCESAGNARPAVTLALGVLAGKRIVVGLVMEWTDETLQRVTTFDNLPIDSPLALSAESFERLWRATAGVKPAAALLCDRATFEGLLRADNKLNYLGAVGHAQPYFYRVELA